VVQAEPQADENAQQTDQDQEPDDMSHVAGQCSVRTPGSNLP
jgi:hypothetical protein